MHCIFYIFIKFDEYFPLYLHVESKKAFSNAITMQHTVTDYLFNNVSLELNRDLKSAIIYKVFY